MMVRLLLISNSTLHGGGYLEHCAIEIKKFLSNKINKVLFVPYALHDREGYANKAEEAFKSFGYGLDSIHRLSDPVEAVNSAQAIFIGGGNTFRLLKTLYDENIVEAIRKRVLKDGVPYMGSSAGSNVATISIKTTNDMPIVYPPSFDALRLVPFNINAHYMEPDPNSKHMGETRKERIRQFHEYEDSPPVLGLREGCMLLVEDQTATLLGKTDAKLFMRGKDSVEYKVGSDMSFLLKSS